jgi:hypothetical protein
LRHRPGFGEGGLIARGSLTRVLEALRDIIARPKLSRALRASLAFGRSLRAARRAKGLFHRR